MPNLFTMPEIIGYLLVMLILFLAKTGKIKFSSPPVLLTLSIAITPVILFNQQIITGRSLQPVHYEIFIANYFVLTAAIFCIWLVTKDISAESTIANMRRGLTYLGAAAIIVGLIETTGTARRYSGFEQMRREAMPALNYLREQKNDPSGKVDSFAVISTDLMVGDYIPTATTFRPLWNPHINSAGGINNATNKQLFFHYLYYSDIDEKGLEKAVSDDVFEAMAAIFGAGRALSSLDGESKPVTGEEKESAIREYAKFRSSFDRAKAADPEMSYIIVPVKAEPVFQKLDQWYQRDEGKTFGLFKIYALKLKP